MYFRERTDSRARGFIHETGKHNGNRISVNEEYLRTRLPNGKPGEFDPTRARKICECETAVIDSREGFPFNCFHCGKTVL